jgi:hypothetical protein
MSAFFILCFVLSVMNGKIEQCICSKLCMKLGKSAKETLEMLCPAFDEQVECQLKMMNVQGDQAPTK